MESKLRSHFTLFSALSGIIGPVLFTVIVVILGTLSTGYNHFAQQISELGEHGAPYATIQDVNFVIFGLFTSIFAIGLYEIGKATRAGSFLVAIFGAIALPGVAVFACDPGCPVPGNSTSQIVHNLLTLIGFISLTIAPLLTWQSARAEPEWRPVSAYSLATTLVAASILAAYLATVTLDLSSVPGLLQRMFLAPLFLWMIIIAIRLVKLARATVPG